MSISVKFLHPRESRTLQADVDPDTMCETCIDGLVAEKFLPPPPPGQPYALMLDRTRQQLLPTTTMGEAGVTSGDSLAVHQMEKGA